LDVYFGNLSRTLHNNQLALFIKNMDAAVLMLHPENLMTFVVTENCIKCKLTDCVEVCPVDCFHEGPNFLVIDPDECIDCTLC